MPELGKAPLARGRRFVSFRRCFKRMVYLRDGPSSFWMISLYHNPVQIRPTDAEHPVRLSNLDLSAALDLPKKPGIC